MDMTSLTNDELLAEVIKEFPEMEGGDPVRSIEDAWTLIDLLVDKNLDVNICQGKTLIEVDGKIRGYRKDGHVRVGRDPSDITAVWLESRAHEWKRVLCICAVMKVRRDRENDDNEQSNTG